ncbi:hyaluronan mediated motility receptor-like [Littorina saxatilis]|uniref:hyaluronan mediated motility receptor-like n=1 Tax=Littorina saxatilis TaxID=31220 RepID=UPI0038B65873
MGVVSAFTVLIVAGLDSAGNILPSTSYSNGTFHLAWHNPVTEGNFTCRVPSQVENCSPEGEGDRRRVAASVAVNGLVARVTVLEALHDAEVTQNQQLKTNASRMVEENQLLRKSVTGLEKSQNELIHQAASFRQQIDNLQAQSNSSALSQLMQRVQTLGASTHHHDNDHASQIHDLQNQVDHLKQTAAQCCLKNTQLTQQTHTLSQQYAQLSTELLNVQRQLNSSGSSLLKDIAGLNQRLNQVDQKCSALDTTVASLGARVSSASQASSALSKQVSGLQLEVDTANQLGSSLTKQVTGLKTQVNQANQATSGLQSDLQSVKSADPPHFPYNNL